jgi:flagellin-like hook-associated protein FlgL
VVVVQQVTGPNSFIATFTKPHAAGDAVYNENGFYIASSPSPQVLNLSFGAAAPTDSPFPGSPAYVVETTSGGFPPADGDPSQIVAVGTVTAGGLTYETISLPPVPNLYGGGWQIFTGVGLGPLPIANPNDGTIKLQVVNTGVSIAVQATYYDTASQTQTVLSNLIAPNSTAYVDGVIITTGNVTANDTGLSSYIKVQQATAPVTNPNTPQFSVLSGADEGNTISLGIPSVSAASIRVSTLTVMGCAATGVDPTLASEDTIGQCDFALDEVLQIRATLGASVIRLTSDSSNDDEAKVALTAADSTVRDAQIDAQIGQAETGFTREDTEVQIGLSVLQQANNLPEQVLKLFR